MHHPFEFTGRERACGKPGRIVSDEPGQSTKPFGEITFRKGFYNSLSQPFGFAEILASGKPAHDGELDRSGESFDAPGFVLQSAFVEKNASHSRTLPLVVSDASKDIVGCVKGHEFSRSHDENHLCVFVAKGHCKSAAHHVAQNIVQDEVVVELFDAQLVQQFEGAENSSSRAANAGLRPSGLHAGHSRKSRVKDGIEASPHGGVRRR